MGRLIDPGRYKLDCRRTEKWDLGVRDRVIHRNLNNNVSGAGWIIQDTVTGQRVIGSLTEWSSLAGSYRGELLGMLAICVFLLAAENFYGNIVGSRS